MHQKWNWSIQTVCEKNGASKNYELAAGFEIKKELPSIFLIVNELYMIEFYATHMLLQGNRACNSYVSRIIEAGAYNSLHFPCTGSI